MHVIAPFNVVVPDIDNDELHVTLPWWIVGPLTLNEVNDVLLITVSIIVVVP
jgi:hypothetical protein